MNATPSKESDGPRAEPKSADRRPLVLVVDDDVDQRDSLACMLEAFGHRVITAGNGGEGLTAILAEHPDLVITDLYMPDMDGLELLSTLRAAGSTPPVIVLSGAVGDGVFDPLTSARKLGADAVFRKPYAPTDVINTIAALLPA